LFRTNVVYENLPASTAERNEEEVRFRKIINLNTSVFNDFDVQLSLFPFDRILKLELEFNQDMLVRKMAQNILHHFDFTLCGIISVLMEGNPFDVVKLGFASLPDSERDLILDFSAGDSYDVPYQYAYQAFEMNALEHPKVTALEHKDQCLSYGELNRKANQLCSILIEKGVTVGNFIPICTTRSMEMIVGILAVLKAGGAYVPIDSSLPSERIFYMLEAISSDVVLVHPDVSVELKDELMKRKAEMISLVQPNNIAINPKRPIPSPRSPAYAIFTSGSTGKPKGVMISHQSLCNYYTCDKTFYDLSLGSRMGQLASINFDVSVSEIFSTLSNSATLVIRDDEDFFAAIRKVHSIEITPTGLMKLNRH
jgi:non-ribosomal peptide synthetase component F